MHPNTIGVLGAGTMGAGIAQLAAQSGARTLLYDPVPEALARGTERIGEALARRVEKGKLSAEEATGIRDRVEATGELSDLGPCDLVIEAAPEAIELKRELLGGLAAAVGEQCVIATNTSSLSVTELAAALPSPGRVIGLHFFNPPAAMRLVELVAGTESSPGALALGRATGEAMGKRVIDAADVAGFLVNRCNRPFSLEALRLLERRIADPAAIDRAMRLGCGFRMGPFELMDLVGLDTNFAVAESLHRASFGEPRYRPSPLQARMVAAGRLGRKSGRGWYESDERDPDPEPPPPGGGEGRPLAVLGELPIAAELRAAAADAGWDVADEVGEAEPWLVVDCRLDADGDGSGVPTARLLAAGALHRLDPLSAGFHALPPLAGAKLIETTATPLTSAAAAARLDELIAGIGRIAQPAGDAPGLLGGRIVCQLINEAALLIGAGNATPDDVDAGMELGLNHPRGPVAWSAAIGLDHVGAVLDALRAEEGGERYAVAPLLRRGLATGSSLAAAG
ncbi:MAG: 3-hydroxybutyryl-CoA dehydrogenase [Solirubrobacterales bacterium]|jgi:3-hydroxybutyryl-CoA dehydrogenase|nr:3-hydroxybutyryl-CoA dehydrogenase [Solirubrobacterales bacterium]